MLESGSASAFGNEQRMSEKVSRDGERAICAQAINSP